MRSFLFPLSETGGKVTGNDKRFGRFVWQGGGAAFGARYGADAGSQAL
jgi:hypothetical protein